MLKEKHGKRSRLSLGIKLSSPLLDRSAGSEQDACLSAACQASVAVTVAAEPFFVGLPLQVVGGFVFEVPICTGSFCCPQEEEERYNPCFAEDKSHFSCFFLFAHCLPSHLDPIQTLMSCNGKELLSLAFAFPQPFEVFTWETISSDKVLRSASVNRQLLRPACPGALWGATL